MSDSATHLLSAAIRGVFDAADAQSQAFARRAGVTCPPGCGACCARPGGVEARVAEMLPAAFALLASGEAAAVSERAGADPDGRCVFFVPSSADGRRGACAYYGVRPGLCRLFGFAAARDKHGAARVSTCAVLRDAAWPDAAGAPLLSSVGERVEELAGAHSGFGELLPVNRALQAALTRAALAESR